MPEPAVDRRRFIIAAIALLGFPATLRWGRAWAQAGAQVDAGGRAAMAAAARRLYPYDEIPDAVYAEVIDAALAATASDGAFAATLEQAERALNSRQLEDFLSLTPEAQIEALRAVEDMAFFGAIQAAVRTRIYNHPAVWTLLGYEGPSFEQGGYLGRGAGEIDWLPEQ